MAQFFDSLGHAEIFKVLVHLEAPAFLLKLFEGLCARGARILSLNGALNSRWIHPTRGVAQGCPLSPLISATMAHVWASFVLRQGVDGFAFCDDRCLWTTPGSNIASLREALAQASRFDRACGLELSSSKCAVISPLSHAPAAALAREVQYQHLDTLSILGVTATVDTSWGLLKFSLRKALLRLRLLRGLGVGRVDCTHILKSLITPCIAWAAGYATPETSDIEAIRQETLYLFDYHAGGQTAAKVLVYEVLGWCLEPQFALDRAVMRLAWNFLLRPPAWQEQRPLRDVLQAGLHVLPQLQPTLERLGWWCIAA